MGVPLFWKILIANTAIVFFGAIVGTVLTAELIRAEQGRSTLELVGYLVLAGVVLSVFVNAVILRLALKPLAQLEETIGRVQQGELEARTPLSRVADRELKRLIRTFNGMLDALAATRERLRLVAATTLSAAEAERQRIARELHDETAQIMATILIRLRLVRNTVPQGVRYEQLDQLQNEVVAALDGVKHIVYGLRPPALDELGLVAALESHVRAVTEVSGVAVAVEIDTPLTGALTADGELALFRIVQEALSNVVHHAEADSSQVSITRDAGRVMVTVEDDGRGFPAAEIIASDHRGLGLLGMQERVTCVGGHLTVESEPGAGTRIVITVPIKRDTLQ